MASSPAPTAGPSMVTLFPSPRLTTHRDGFSGAGLPAFFALTTLTTWSRFSPSETARPAIVRWSSGCSRVAISAAVLGDSSPLDAIPDVVRQLEQAEGPDDGLVGDVQLLGQPAGRPGISVHQRLEGPGLLEGRQILAQAVLDELVDQDIGPGERGFDGHARDLALG